MAPELMFPSQSSVFADQLEGEQSLVEIECVMPQDQIQNAKKWRSMRLKQKIREARDKVMLTQRVREPLP